jgi:hypothetical protein
MATFTTNTTGIKFKEINQGDPDFTMTDGIKLVSRASFKISQRCPSNYASLIQECINHGWLKPVAYVKESDYVWEKLGE